MLNKIVLVKLDKYKNNITVENLADCLKLRDSIMILGERVCVYAGLRANEDSTNSFYQGLDSKSDRLISVMGSATAFIEPEILGLDENKLISPI